MTNTALTDQGGTIATGKTIARRPEAYAKGKKGRDLLKGRLRLEPAQTVAAAAVKHAFFPPTLKSILTLACFLHQP